MTTSGLRTVKALVDAGGEVFGLPQA
jgi:hypothetical protein